MKILLLGEYSNVHWTLALGLRKLGHKVTVVSNGDFWKNYPRDISLVRKERAFDGMRYYLKLLSVLPFLRGYDIVQLINPMFLELKAERILPIYHYLRKHNKRMVMGAFGMDYYWIKTCDTPNSPFKYSDFNIGPQRRHNADANKERKDWIGTAKEKLNTYIANDCDAIVAGLYEYWRCYNPLFQDKTTFIPFPIQLDQFPARTNFYQEGNAIKLFIGISKKRSAYKGTDIMLKAAKAVEAQYPQQLKVLVAEGLPFAEYCKLMEGADIIADQLYSYTPAMNALQAMSRGIVCMGGGEPENYQIIHEKKLKPIINVQPTYESVYKEIEKIVLQPSLIELLQRQSIEYVNKHHEYVKVAKQYERLYDRILETQINV